MKDLFLELEVLTPVHIGTDETLDPMSYLIREGKEGPAFYTLDVMAWIADQVNPDELAILFGQNNVPAIRDHLATNIDPGVYAGRGAEMAAPLALAEYREKLADQQSLHSLRLRPGLTNPLLQTLLIPGSSVKGAVRTAIIDLLDRQERLGLKTLRAKDSKGRALAEKLEHYLGDIRSSAFKQLKIGDFEGFLDTSIIVDAQEKSRKAEKKATPKDPCEVLPSRIMRPSGQWRLHGRGKLGSQTKQDDGVLRLQRGNYKWGWDDLAKVVNDFYQERYRQEKAKFYGLLHFSNTDQALEEVDDAILKPEPGEMVLRVGHYSHVECVTITDNNPLTRRIKDKQLPYGTTRTLAGGIYPFGWIKLRPCSEAAYTAGVKKRHEYNHGVLATRQQKKAAIIAAKDVEKLERKKKVQAAEARRQQELQLQAQWDAMTEEERDLAIVRRDKMALCYAPNLNPLKDVWPKIESAGPEHQKALAAAFKELWEKEKRWAVKKNKQKKQWEKVQRVKEILASD